MPAETAHHVGGTKHFECRVKGHPRPEIRWYKDGKEITHILRYQFDHSQEGIISMVIPNITHDDEGHYRCRAENSEGFASTSAYLFVRGHKEHPEEATTSFHAMQIEEAVLFTEKEKAARKESKLKVSGPHFETRMEEINGDYSKEKQVFKDEESVVHKTVESVTKSSTTTSIISSSTTTSTSGQKPEKDIAEQESTKISADMLEKSYHSSDESNDDVDSVRLRTISERSETTSMKESPGDYFNGDRSSLLMRQTKRLFSHDFTDESDLFQMETSTMLEKSASRTETTSVSTTETAFARTGSVKVELSSSNVKSVSEETRLESTRAGRLDYSTAATSQTARVENGEVTAQTSTPTSSPLSQTRSATLEAAVTESAMSLMSTTPAVGKAHVTVEESRSSRSFLEEAVDVKSGRSNKGQTEIASSPFTQGDSGFQESSSNIDNSLLKSFEAEVSDATSLVQPEASSKISADTTLKEVSKRGTEDDSEKLRIATETEEESIRFSNKQVGLLGVSVETESKKIAVGEVEETESVSESETGSSVGSVVGVGVDLSDVQTQKLQKQESKEKDETEEEAKQAILATADRKLAKVKDEVERDDDERKAEVDVEKLSDVHNEKKYYLGSKLTHEEDVTSKVEDKDEKIADDEVEADYRKKADFPDSKEAKAAEMKVEAGYKEKADFPDSKEAKADFPDSKEAKADFPDSKEAKADFPDSKEAKAAEMKVEAGVSDEELAEDKKKTKVDVSEEVETRGVKKVKVDDGMKLTGKEKDVKSDDDVTDGHGDQRKGRSLDKDLDTVDSLKKEENEEEVKSRRRRRPLQDEEGSSEETVEERVSWTKKVEEEKDKDKAEKKEIDDATAKEGDKEDESLPSEPRIIQKMENTKVECGKTLKLSTQVQAAPKPDVTWSRDGTALQEGGRITIITDDDVYSLEIEEVSESDAGTYRLTAVNSAGEVFSDVIVSVTSAVPSSLAPGDRELSLTATVGIPQFLVRPQDVSVAEFETIKLTCSVTGDPAPKVAWEKDGQVVRSNRRVRVYESRGIYNLEIHNCEAEDVGEYVCTAVNSRGQVTASVNVIIEGVESVMSTTEPAEAQGVMAEPGEEPLVGATGGGTESSSDVCSSDTRTVRYLKLIGMAAAFSLAAFGVKKVMENLPK